MRHIILAFLLGAAACAAVIATTGAMPFERVDCHRITIDGREIRVAVVTPYGARPTSASTPAARR